MLHCIIRLEEISKENLEWIKDFSNSYSGLVTCTIEDESVYFRDTYSVILQSNSYPIIHQMATFIVSKLQIIDHLENCSGKSTGRKYWVFYFIRTLHMTMKNLLKKVLKSFTFKSTSKSS